MSRNLVNSLAFFSPIIISTGILVFSIFSDTIIKGLFFLFWILVITFLRIVVLMSITSGPLVQPDICANSALFPYDNSTYSIYMLCFTAMYFIIPMIYMNNLNFGIMLFFIVYIIFDIVIKVTYGCVINMFGLIGDIAVGLGLGAAVSAVILSTPIKKYLYINEVNKNKEVCSKPSKQTFKCNVYKNGELISSSIR